MNITFERLFSKAEILDSGCIQWTAAKNKFGYGKIACGKGRWGLAHRVAWAAANGAIPEGMEVCHRCDNRACINPDHLFLGTHAENMRDCKNKGRAKAHRGESNPRSKLTESDVLAIRSSSLSSDDESIVYGVSSVLVRKIRQRKLWKHLPEAEAMAEAFIQEAA